MPGTHSNPGRATSLRPEKIEPDVIDLSFYISANEAVIVVIIEALALQLNREAANEEQLCSDLSL
jgi:hypothetical protein